MHTGYLAQQPKGIPGDLLHIGKLENCRHSLKISQVLHMQGNWPNRLKASLEFCCTQINSLTALLKAQQSEGLTGDLLQPG